MAPFPEPRPGLVIRYAYLWRREALAGQEDGQKERPCVVVLAVRDLDGRKVVTVAPITHSPPERPELAIRMPPAVKARLSLDHDESWIVAADLNRFVWPGPDLRPASGAQTYAYGLIPAALYDQLRQRVLALARAGQARLTPRTE
ncbi:MAG: type II toxin-antitoxin system PemK/MazF family toxin [Phenylobacterium sp.]|nr:type II toxin-antitoxin system PemK/MazF family toxin [Phenylobacterium sp.]